MHPMLMTMMADERSKALRGAADHGRRFERVRPRRSFTLRLPRRARVAHV